MTTGRRCGRVGRAREETMKRTVTRWVLGKPEEVGYSKPNELGMAKRTRVEVTFDDGEPEVARCPCDSPRLGMGGCCQHKESAGAACCKCHVDASGSTYHDVRPCLSDFHKPARPALGCRCAGGKCCGETFCRCHERVAQPATRDRVVEGFVGYDAAGVIKKGISPWFYQERLHDSNVPATLIIHEPVREPTLYEAVEALFTAWSVPSSSETGYVSRLRAAFNREKAARERGKS